MTIVKHRGGDVDHARYDPALAIVSLFRPVCRGRRPGGYSIEHHQDGNRIKFNIWKALDNRDQSVLLAAVGLAGMLIDETVVTHKDIQHPKGQQLWLDLEPAEQAIMQKALVVKTTRYALLHAAGLSDRGVHYKQLEDCLERLSMVGCRVRTASGQDFSMRLLSYAEAENGELHIALNPRFAEALSGHHVRVDLVERQTLDSDTAQILHTWLSAWLRPGKTSSIRLDKLAEKVFGPASKAAATNRKRRERVKAALDKVAKLSGWSVAHKGRGASAQATIKRPALLKE